MSDLVGTQIVGSLTHRLIYLEDTYNSVDFRIYVVDFVDFYFDLYKLCFFFHFLLEESLSLFYGEHVPCTSIN